MDNMPLRTTSEPPLSLSNPCRSFYCLWDPLEVYLDPPWVAISPSFVAVIILYSALLPCKDGALYLLNSKFKYKVIRVPQEPLRRLKGSWRVPRVQWGALMRAGKPRCFKKAKDHPRDLARELLEEVITKDRRHELLKGVPTLNPTPLDLDLSCTNSTWPHVNPNPSRPDMNFYLKLKLKLKLSKTAYSLTIFMKDLCIAL